jgi:hypothetical protein
MAFFERPLSRRKRTTLLCSIWSIPAFPCREGFPCRQAFSCDPGDLGFSRVSNVKH